MPSDTLQAYGLTIPDPLPQDPSSHSGRRRRRKGAEEENRKLCVQGFGCRVWDLSLADALPSAPTRR